MTAPAIMRQVKASGISPTWRAINPKAASIIMAVPAVRPLKPSMILMALATPPTAKAVNMTEISVKLKSQSIPQISTCVSDVPVIPQPSTPEAMVARRRTLTETFFVMSSMRPKTKAGMPASSMALRIARFSAAAIPWLDTA
ncbi:hypothetical protein SDC9_203411 [bioreactor metagenome]|uniref:Uncharacterized protein n=1 Tax=bioreactor metagenome TaxID=1076179 RepID=A0A645IX66_9ZZZZ